VNYRICRFALETIRSVWGLRQFVTVKGWSYCQGCRADGIFVYAAGGRILTPDLPAGCIVRHNGANQLQEAAMTAEEKPGFWNVWKTKHPQWHRLWFSN
jgi:hypothetical protein